MNMYEPKDFEAKWRKEWEESGVYAVPDTSDKPKCYVLDMFPYPSGDGLHVGHTKGYIATDIYSRFKNMKGFEVLHPMGWDAFGLPAENYALKNKVHPRTATDKNIARYKEQLSNIGFNYDWSREINTTDPAFYKWTQWAFLKMYEKGLAYESYEPINWCPSCQTGLANEDLEGNQCERCGTVVEKKPMRQWVIKITEYAERMLADLEGLDWPESIKESQRNWIGRSEGAEIDFELKTDEKCHFVLIHGYKGSPAKNFHPWLLRELESRGHTAQILELPHPDVPSVSEQVEYVLKNVEFTENTVLVGHSLGTVVAMKALERAPRAVKKTVLVGAFLEPKFKDGKRREFEDTFDWEFDFKTIRKNAGEVVFIRPKNDDVIPEDQAEKIQKNIGGEIWDVVAQEEHVRGKVEPSVLRACVPHVTVYTTRPDTLYGATYMVLAPEHEYVSARASSIKNFDEVERYLEEVSKKTEIERTAEGKEKTGVRLEGVTAVNPATGEEIPVFIADYVLAHYGTGAVMAVPAHDERDHVFAKKFGLPAPVVIEPETGEKHDDEVYRRSIVALVHDTKNKKILSINWGPKKGGNLLVGGGLEEGEDVETCARREVQEETGYTDIEYIGQSENIHHHYYAANKKLWREIEATGVHFELRSDKNAGQTLDEIEQGQFAVEWINEGEASEKIADPLHKYVFEKFVCGGIHTGAGRLADSGEFTGMESEEAKRKITEHVGGRWVVKYKLRDWVFSRQRYWGEPIPIVHCEKCGTVPVPESELPVILPEVEHYEPTGTGESPLAGIEEWVNTTCPSCGGSAKRETNTMPQWAGSSWYYLRYIDPKNERKLVDIEKEKYWSPVDMYVGGAEHATRHLIYARFWHKFLYDIGVVNDTEPFMRLQHVGLIQAEDGRKMSKRYANVINPDDVVQNVGADTLRIYEMFMGPFDQSIAWSTDQMVGSRRFLERVWRLQERVSSESGSEEVERALHKAIKKVGEDIEAFRFNTAISQMMILVGEMEKAAQVSRAHLEAFLTVLAPFAPHISEELWHLLGGEGSVHARLWPAYDPEKIKEASVRIAFQVNGKVRDVAEFSADVSEEDMRAAALMSPKVRKHMEKKEPRKIIVIPGKIVNIVV